MSAIDAKDVKLEGCKVSFTDFCNTKDQKHIISSKNSPVGDWNKSCLLKAPVDGILKKVIPIDFRDFCMLVVTEVPPNTVVPEHGHAEGIVRYIIEGSLTLNDIFYEAGEWVLVPEGMKYLISTETGYKAIAGYLMACETTS